MNRQTPFSMPDEGFVPQVRVPVKAVVIGLATAGALIGISGGTPAHMWTTLPVALLILTLAGLGWLLEAWKVGVAGWFVSLSLILAVVLLHIQLEAPGALVLLVLPAALSVIMLGNRAGITVTLAATLVVLYLWRAALVSPVEAALAVAAMWSILLVYWATFRSIHHLVNWSWTHYQQAQQALDDVRANRAYLHQTLDDLAHANRQLALMNKQLAAAQLAAEEARKAKAAFVANVSHEFRTPLNMIIGLADLLVESPQVYGSRLPIALLEDLEIVRRNSQHLLGMVNDVLDLSQIEANRLALHRDRVRLNEVVERAAAVVKPLLVKKQVHMQVDLPPDLPDIYCDGARVRQVIVNLLSNAARHTEGGSVSVQVSHDGFDVTVCVRDTGPGIAPEDAPHIFEPFYRGTFGARRNEGGSGLGLSISKQFIEMHDGRMWLESELGAGSSFYFSLPITTLSGPAIGADRWLVEEWQWRERSQPSQLPGTPHKPRVLICDANPDLCEAFARFNDRVEYVRVDSLEAAAEEARHFPAQTVIVNELSPRLLLEGVTQAHQIFPDLPVIGCSLSPKLGHALAAGASGQLLKPVTRAELAAVVAQIEPPPRTVLVVDDDPDARRLFPRMLTASNPDLRVVTADGGAEALEKMKSEEPDLVLLDIMLPDMDGWQVLASKEEDEALRSIPVFLLSAQDPHDEPLASQIIMATMGERTPFHKLLQCAEVIPAILRHPAG
jgi:signal transduction histidine kinase/CheY-like chemotaxis protein